ncbi:hypothetical protein GCM10025768_21670 [Microbacterium pseudoresistens]
MMRGQRRRTTVSGMPHIVACRRVSPAHDLDEVLYAGEGSLITRHQCESVHMRRRGEHAIEHMRPCGCSGHDCPFKDQVVCIGAGVVEGEALAEQISERTHAALAGLELGEARRRVQ